MQNDTITPADLVNHMLTAGTRVEWIVFAFLLVVLAVWVVIIVQSIAYSVADVRRINRARRAANIYRAAR